MPGVSGEEAAYEVYSQQQQAKGKTVPPYEEFLKSKELMMAKKAASQVPKQAIQPQTQTKQQSTAAPIAGGGQAPPAKACDKVVEIPGDRTYIYMLHADGSSTAYTRGNPPKFFKGPFSKGSAVSQKIAQNAK